MTDNEKRAHDFAIAMLHIIYDKEYKGTLKSGGNALEIYKENYKDFLADCERNVVVDN